jgi:hypothetical protein
VTWEDPSVVGLQEQRVVPVGRVMTNDLSRSVRTE